VKFGIRKPSLRKRIAARTSVSRFVRHSLGFKAPRGFGWFTNPKRAVYNRIYNRTTRKADGLMVAVIMLAFAAIGGIVTGIASLFSSSGEQTKPARRRGWLWAVGAVSFAVLGLLNWMGTSATNTGLGNPSAPPATDLIAISIAGLPPGAKIIVDGQSEPSTFSLPRTGGRHNMEVSCPGYVRYEGTFDGSRSADLIVTLTRANPPRRKRIPGTQPPVERPSAAKTADDHTASRSALDDFPTTTNVSGTGASERPGGRLSVPNTETTPAAGAPTPADKGKWVDPFEDEKPAMGGSKKTWVDPFAQ
jgi:hypothetical protein